MPSNQRYFSFSSPPFSFLARQLAQDQDFLRDAQQILDLDSGTYAQLVARLSSTEAFLDRHVLTSLVKEVVGKEEEAQDLALIISRIAKLLHDADIPASEAMNELAIAIDEKAKDLEPDSRKSLGARLRGLAAEPVGFTKQYKAQELAGAIGSELNGFRFICDIRPIFDQEHTRIQGALPLTILHLEYTLPDGEDMVLELRTTQNQLVDFKSKIADAQRKTELIKQLLMKQEVPVPLTDSTAIDGE